MQVRLVDLVREEHEVVLLADAHDALHRRLVQQRARRVPRVDDDERLGRDAVPDGVLDRGFDLWCRRRPLGVLVEVVGYAHAGVGRKGCRVQRVLRDRDEDPRAGVGDQHRDKQRHARGCACGQEYVVRIGGVAIALWVGCVREVFAGGGRGTGMVRERSRHHER